MITPPNKIQGEHDNFQPEAKIYCDGASSGNPGVAGMGVVIQMTGSSDKIYKISEHIGITTNNIAEYSALIRGLELAKSLRLKSIEVFLDSELLVKQIKGIYKTRNANLKPLWEKSISILKQFGEYRIIHVRREFNVEADSLAKKAIKKFRQIKS